MNARAFMAQSFHRHEDPLTQNLVQRAAKVLIERWAKPRQGLTYESDLTIKERDALQRIIEKDPDLVVAAVMDRLRREHSVG